MFRIVSQKFILIILLQKIHRFPFVDLCLICSFHLFGNSRIKMEISHQWLKLKEIINKNQTTPKKSSSCILVNFFIYVFFRERKRWKMSLENWDNISKTGDVTLIKHFSCNFFTLIKSWKSLVAFVCSFMPVYWKVKKEFRIFRNL